MPIANSPLRYPGGKSILADFLGDVLTINGLEDGTYVEPYAGGAGAALTLLFGEYIHKIILNDLDPCIYAFWNALFNRKDDLVRRIKESPVTIEEWKRQRDIYLHQKRHSRIKVAFASFFLNRCNRSGIIDKAGPIGGQGQDGKWKIDARFNKNELIERIEKIYLYKERIEIYNLDAIEFLRQVICQSKETDSMLVYLDPPYYSKGSQLYQNHYKHQDHETLANFLKKTDSFRWLLTYDNVGEINDMYGDCERIPFKLSYSAYKRRTGCELLIHRDDLFIPKESLELAI